MNRLVGLVFFVQSHFGISQNFIPNPGFEDLDGCPTGHTTRLEPIKTFHWYSPTQGTPDVFSACSFGEMSTPRNWVGVAYPPEGKNYVGMYFGSPSQTEEKCYREYLTCPLIKPLDSGLHYQLRFRAKPATSSAFHIDRLSVAFTTTAPGASHDGYLKNISPLTFKTDTLPVVAGWYEVRHIFRSTSNSQFFTIGDFIPPREAGFEQVLLGASAESGVAYYLFDDFSLSPWPDQWSHHIISKCWFELDSIFFAFDSYEVTNGRNQLVELAHFLKNQPESRLEILGSADSIGTKEYNAELSLKRAQAVKNELIHYGLSGERITAFGLGESKESGLPDNLERRVVFRIVNRVGQKEP